MCNDILYQDSSFDECLIISVRVPPPARPWTEETKQKAKVCRLEHRQTVWEEVLIDRSLADHVLDVGFRKMNECMRMKKTKRSGFVWEKQCYKTDCVDSERVAYSYRRVVGSSVVGLLVDAPFVAHLRSYI